MSIRTVGLRWSALGLLALVLTGCATGSSAKHGAAAAKRGEWDAAVAYYRQALDSDPKKIELQIELERATRQASAQHLARGRELESQDQLSAAAAEYRRAIEFDPSNSLALTRALDVERRIREQIEASRPQSRLDQMRAQAQATSPIPRLDPRAPLPALRFTNNAVRDVLNAIGTATGIGVQYDQGLEGTVGRPFSIDLSGHSLESAFNMVLSQNTLAFKILDSKTIFIYLDNQGNRAKYEDVYQQTFYLSHGEVGEVSQILNQMLTTTTAGNRPVVTQNKGANAIVVRASAPMLGVIKNIIDGADKPKAEVLIDVTILEVSRSSLKNLGLDLSTYAITLSFSPSGPPAVGPAPPIQVGGVTNAFNKNNVYAALPSAIINILESDQKTRLLAKPQLRGREGAQLILNLGQDVPIITTTIGSIATGGVATVPQAQYTYRSIGVNLSITPKVTYQDEIILEPITVDKSAIGPNVITGGQSLQSFIKRTATVSMRLRDGESNLLAGLVLQEDRETARSIPGILHIPILRSIFGNTDTTNDQSDVVMIVTPHIIRSRDITAEDLKPFYVGTSNNLGAASAPGLMSQAPPPGPAPTGTPIPGSPIPGSPVPTPIATPNPTPATTPPPRAVAIEPANTAPTSQPPAGGAQILMQVPSAELQKDGAPYTMPISISNVSQLSAVTLTITYDPKVLKATAVSQGTFMSQGNVTPIFVPKIDEATGRVDVAISRGATNPGANGTNVLIGVAFQAIGAGTSKITVTGTAMTPESKPIALQLPPPGTVIVK